MNPIQTIKYGNSFPQEKQSNGSLFIRMDMDGAKVFQYNSKKDVYTQIEGIKINANKKEKSEPEPEPEEQQIQCANYYAKIFSSINGSSYSGPYYGYKGILTNERYRYRLFTDWDNLLYTQGYIDPIPYAPTYKVDGHVVCEIQYDNSLGVFKEVVVESSSSANPGYLGGNVGQTIQIFSPGVFPLITTTSEGSGVSDHHVTMSEHGTHVLFNVLFDDFGNMDFGYNALSQEEISIISRGTK